MEHAWLLLFLLTTLQACDRYLVSKLPDQGTNWDSWLVTADRTGMPLLTARCVKPVLSQLLQGPCDKGRVQWFGKLGRTALLVLFETTLKAAFVYKQQVSNSLPDASSWKSPGDLFSS